MPRQGPFPFPQLPPCPNPETHPPYNKPPAPNPENPRDGATAHALSEEGKRHGALMDQYNKQASEYIFRENNAVGRVDGDTIDLHGQFVEEAEEILERRIRYARGTGQTHLHVYVFF